jgi:hypothetical protein
MSHVDSVPHTAGCLQAGVLEILQDKLRHWRYREDMHSL